MKSIEIKYLKPNDTSQRQNLDFDRVCYECARKIDYLILTREVTERTITYKSSGDPDTAKVKDKKIKAPENKRLTLCPECFSPVNLFDLPQYIR